MAHKNRFVGLICDTYRTKYLTLLFSTSFPAQTAQSNATSSSSSAAPPSLSGTPSDSAANQFKMSHTILPNTSIAATSCVPGDRWVFIQDATGAIRGAQFTISNSTWSTKPQEFNSTPTSNGTALSASCVNFTEDSGSVGLSAGLYVRSPP